MNLYAVMFQEGINDWVVCTEQNGIGGKRACVYPNKKSAELALKEWVDACGPDNYKVAKLDVVVIG